MTPPSKGDDLTDIEYPDEPVGEPAEGSNDRRGTQLVYVALGAGAVVLAILLLIVWLSSRDDDSGQLPLCLDITAPRAIDAVLAGNVEQIDVLLDQHEPLNGLTAIQLQMVDGDCRRLPEGADNRQDLFQLLGAAELYNEAGERRIDIRYLRQDVPAALMRTSTPVRTPTIEPSPTDLPTMTPAPSRTPTIPPTLTPTPAPSPTATFEPTVTPVSASPQSSPLASPVASPASSPSAAASGS